MYGFGITAKSAKKVYEAFKTPQVIPSQILDYNAFPLSATRSGILSNINMSITNCICISIMFHKHDHNYPVFENPVYNNVQLTVNVKNLPDEPVSLQGARFLQYQYSITPFKKSTGVKKRNWKCLDGVQNKQTSTTIKQEHLEQKFLQRNQQNQISQHKRHHLLYLSQKPQHSTRAIDLLPQLNPLVHQIFQ